MQRAIRASHDDVAIKRYNAAVKTQTALPMDFDGRRRGRGVSLQIAGHQYGRLARTIAPHAIIAAVHFEHIGEQRNAMAGELSELRAICRRLIATCTGGLGGACTL